jgi:chromosome segregation ATPase
MSSVTPNQPGSLNEENGFTGSTQSLVEKNEMRKLNHRLGMLISSQADRTKEINALKSMISSQEVEFRARLKENERQYEMMIAKLRTDNENYQINLKTLQDESNTINQEKREIETRLEASEARGNEQASRIESMQQENNLLKKEIDSLRNSYAVIKCKYDNYETEKSNLLTQLNVLKEKCNGLVKDVAKKSSENKTVQDALARVLKEKTDEIDKYKQQVLEEKISKEEITNRFRIEYDQKLTEYVTKREEQYRLEKEEWMKIFKEEYNRKIHSFKEANDELVSLNQKNEEELNDLRNRLAQTKQSKTELETTCHNLEEELDKLRSDLNTFRQSKDEEIRQKSLWLNEWKDKCKQKEIEFNELSNAKTQLAQEIDLYRQMLSEAEKVAGYGSPMEFNNRKKRKLNHNYDSSEAGNSNVNNHQDTNTPGIIRGAHLARKELNCLNNININENNNNGRSDQNKDTENETHVTPGESYPLQFSTIDLPRSMIEIQNISEHCVQLKGYTLSNRDGSCQFALPSDRTLQPSERVKVVVGLKAKPSHGNILWKADVWSGEEQDEIRLHDASNREIAQIQISPEMLLEKSSGCILM